MKYPLAFAAAVAALLPAAALAQTDGSVTADLNVRQGPGSNYPVVATVPSGGDITIVGCLEGSSWCEVDADGTAGYAFSRYLAVEEGGSTVVVSEQPGLVGLITAPVSIAAGALGTIAGTLTGGGFGAGGSSSSAPSSSFQSPPEVIDYVRNNPPGEPVYLEGEAVPGAVIPAGIPLADVPDTQYQYVNVNGDYAIVDRSSRQVVYVVR